jgi:SNF2-related domain
VLRGIPNRIHPSGVVAMTKLLDVQKAALKASSGHHGFAFWMEMGLGKTLTALTEFLYLVTSREATRLVVVCPNSFKSGWVAEIDKQKIPVDYHIYESGGYNSAFLVKGFNEKPPVLIVNYEAIRRPNTQEYIHKFIAGRNAMIVFDESIQLKNNKSQQTKAAIELAKHFAYKRILSGKPQTQGPQDLWGQMRSIGQIEGSNFYVFRNTFCRMGGYMAKKVVGAQNEKLLAETINPHVFRASKADWLDLPPKLYTMREYKMTDAQQYQYNTMEHDFVTWLAENEFVAVDMALTKYIKLAQVQFGFIIDDDGKAHNLVEDAVNPRVIALKEIIDTEVTGKVVVVYHHRHAGEILLRALASYSPTYIRGQMTDAAIAGNRNTFNNDPNCRVILIQTIAGKYGHTLVGGTEPQDHCSTMVFAENTWSLDTRSQLEDRIHRIGQQGESCLYIDLFGSNLDKRVAGALQMKEDVFDAVFQHIHKSTSSLRRLAHQSR